MRHGSEIDPPNRFERIHAELDEASNEAAGSRQIEYLSDDSRTIVTENSSPDIPFRFSINPYRGCIHGCSYCYARPTHEYLGLSAGLDFETKIIVKQNAPQLFREFLAKKSWRPEAIAFSGVTDCYQPAERHFRLTEQCLQVALEARQPVGIVTKNALVERDLQVLSELATRKLIHVFVSITTLDPSLAREMEPRTSIPEARLRAISSLADAGVPVGVMVAPIIPGLNDNEAPAILAAAKNAGAQTAGHVLLRLPMTVAPVFQQWLERSQPLKAQRVISRVRQTRQGNLSSANFFQRMTGSGPLAEQIRTMFEVFKRKYQLDQGLPDYDTSQFRRPPKVGGQPWLF